MTERLDDSYDPAMLLAYCYAFLGRFSNRTCQCANHYQWDPENSNGGIPCDVCAALVLMDKIERKTEKTESEAARDRATGPQSDP